jgi:hypothetical protein
VSPLAEAFARAASFVGFRGGCGIRLRFCILNALGDVLDDGELHFVETAKTLGRQGDESKHLQRSGQVSTSSIISKPENESPLPQGRSQEPCLWSRDSEKHVWHSLRLRSFASTRRRFRLAELVSPDCSSDAHAIGTTFRNFFDTNYSSLPADKCMRRLPRRLYRKLNSHSYADALADPEVKTVSRNIACPSQDRLGLFDVGLESDFNLKG